MSLTAAILMMIGAWILVAAAMLWGVLRIARRHHAATPAPARRKTDASAQGKARSLHRLNLAH